MGGLVRRQRPRAAAAERQPLRPQLPGHRGRRRRSRRRPRNRRAWPSASSPPGAWSCPCTAAPCRSAMSDTTSCFRGTSASATRSRPSPIGLWRNWAWKLRVSPARARRTPPARPEAAASLPGLSCPAGYDSAHEAQGVLPGVIDSLPRGPPCRRDRPSRPRDHRWQHCPRKRTRSVGSATCGRAVRQNHPWP